MGLRGCGEGIAMAVHRFTQSEMHYLRMLPAVAHVTSARITYSDQFREDATRRYLAGESPVKIFRDAGLDPRLIGYKRIERAFARWKKDELPATNTVHTDDESAVKSNSSAANDAVGEVRAALAVSLGSMDDNLKDKLIAKQALRIAELEMQRDQLLEQLKAVF